MAILSKTRKNQGKHRTRRKAVLKSGRLTRAVSTDSEATVSAVSAPSAPTQNSSVIGVKTLHNSPDTPDTPTTVDSPNKSDNSPVGAGAAVGAAHPDANLEAFANRAQAAALTKFNRLYAFAEIGSESRVPAIIQFADDGDLECRRRIPDFHKFIELTTGERVPVYDSRRNRTVLEPASKWWLEHPKHRWYSRVVLAPPGSPQTLGPTDYNLWRGFAIQPKPGDWSKNREFMFRIICGGDDRLFAWLMNWTAALLQRPGQHGSVAPLLVGGQGIGKGHFARKTLGSVFRRRQFAHLGNADELTGTFSEHLSGKVLVFADESFWGMGNNAAADVLKRLITEDTIMIHPKYFPRFEEPSNLHIIIASNAQRPLPVERDDRRLAVFQVSEARKQDIRYFTELHEELDHGGRAAMMHDLLNVDINEEWLRVPPVTAAKGRMKADSLEPTEHFWLEQLQCAELWPCRMAKDTLHKGLVAWWTEHRFAGHVPTKEQFGSRLIALFKRGGYQDLAKPAKTHGTNRREAWSFPSLDECRRILETATGTNPDWVAVDGASDPTTNPPLLENPTTPTTQAPQPRWSGGFDISHLDLRELRPDEQVDYTKPYETLRG